MDKLEKYRLMQKVQRELEDLKNSQTAILKKVGQIEVENFDLNDKQLEKDVADTFAKVSDQLDGVTEITTAFDERVETFRKDNNISLEEEEEEA